MIVKQVANLSVKNGLEGTRMHRKLGFYPKKNKKQKTKQNKYNIIVRQLNNTNIT